MQPIKCMYCVVHCIIFSFFVQKNMVRITLEQSLELQSMIKAPVLVVL